jgi:hypothetical protein
MTRPARAIGVQQITVQYWAATGKIPGKWHAKIVSAGSQVGMHIDAIELRATGPSASALKTSGPSNAGLPSPFAKWRGKIDLGGDELDVYVLDTGERVISLRSAVRSIAEADSGDLAKFIGVSSLKPFINNDLILAELKEFSIPGTQFSGRGMTTEHFELICRAYVRALYEKAPLTDRQKEIAIKCDARDGRRLVSDPYVLGRYRRDDGC